LISQSIGNPIINNRLFPRPTNPLPLAQDTMPTQMTILSGENVDLILGDPKMTINDRTECLTRLLENNINVESNFLTKLLGIREETPEYLSMFKTIMGMIRKPIFNYEHIDSLVFKSWMVPLKRNISVKYFIQLIEIGFKNAQGWDNDKLTQIPETILSSFIYNHTKWFDNYGINPYATELIDWLIKHDETDTLFKLKIQYTNDMIVAKSIPKRETDPFLSQKKNGLCKYKRKGLECPSGTSCKFYHGRIEHTFGVQECHDKTCEHLKRGRCVYVHKPDRGKKKELHNLFSIGTIDGDTLLVSNILSVRIDYRCIHDPFCVLKKVEVTSGKTKYVIPKCELNCDRTAVFMVKNPKENDTMNVRFYCCYEHMESNEKIINPEGKLVYCIKQNCMSDIFKMDF
jgi:hypothetical protein